MLLVPSLAQQSSNSWRLEVLLPQASSSFAGAISMESGLIGSLGIRFSQLGFEGNARRGLHQSPAAKAGFVFPAKFRCGLRGMGPRKQLWRGRVLSTEAIHAVQALKLAKPSHSSASSSSSSSNKLEDVFSSRIGRLLKADLIAVLAELQRQNEWELALQVFAFIRQEVWYKPDLSLYSDMIFMLGKNKLIGTAEELFSELKKEGLKPNTRAYTEMMGAFLQVGMVEKAMEMYQLLKESGCTPSELTFTILIRNLEMNGEEDLADAVKKDCAEFMDFPERFLEEINKIYPKRRSLKLV